MKYAEENQDDYRGWYYREGGYGGDEYGRYPNYMYDHGTDESHHIPGESYNRGYNTRSRDYDSRRYNYGHEPHELMQHTISELERVMSEMPEGIAKDQIRQHVQKMRSEMK